MTYYYQNTTISTKEATGRIKLTLVMTEAYQNNNNIILRAFAEHDAIEFVSHLSEGEIYRQLRVRGFKFDAKKDLWHK